MRTVAGMLMLTAVAASQAPGASNQMQPASSMSELMVKIIYPASDAIFYITTRTPNSEVEWEDVQAKALAVAESANLLMMPGRARDQDRWLQDATLMLEAGRAAYRAAKAKNVAALEALNDQLYTSCTTCHQHYRSNYGRRPSTEAAAPLAAEASAPAPAPAPKSSTADPAPDVKKLEGRWKLRAVEDLRADGTVAGRPWGEHPIGSLVVERGACFVQVMSSDTPSFDSGTTTAAVQMKAALLASYMAYSGRCSINESEGSITVNIDESSRPDDRNTQQKMFFSIANGVLLFGPAPATIRAGNEMLTRCLTLDRVQ